MKNLKRIFTNLIIKIKQRINCFNEYENPIYYWWKARKYIKFPNIRIYCGKYTWIYGLPLRKDYYNPIIGIRSTALGYKFKYDDPVFEFPPMINIVFFRKYQITFIFTYIKKNDNELCKMFLDDMIYTSILYYIHRNKSIKKELKSYLLKKEIKKRLFSCLK